MGEGGTWISVLVDEQRMELEVCENEYGMRCDLVISVELAGMLLYDN